jgi:hypothetical protein
MSKSCYGCHCHGICPVVKAMQNFYWIRHDDTIELYQEVAKRCNLYKKG